MIMHWIQCMSLYDYVLIALLLYQLFQPTQPYLNPAILVTGLVVKELVLAHPLMVARLLVLFMSVVQVYVILPLTRVWEKCRRRTRARRRNNHDPNHDPNSKLDERPEITCMHNFRDAHHIATAGCTNQKCKESNAYRVRYKWLQRQYSMLLPAVDSPRALIAACIARIGQPAQTKRMCPPWVVADVLCEEAGGNWLNLTAAIVEVLGPERDGHAALSHGMSLRVHPMPFIVWMSLINASAQTANRLTSNSCSPNSPRPELNADDDDSDADDDIESKANSKTHTCKLSVRYRSGHIRSCEITDNVFTVADLVALCNSRVV